MDTVTLFADYYKDLQDSAFRKSAELAYIQGTIKALATMEGNPEFVFSKLKEMAEKIEKGVDISA